MVIIFLENTRDFPEIITSTGAQFPCKFCPSVLVLVISQAPIPTRKKKKQQQRFGTISLSAPNPQLRGQILYFTPPPTPKNTLLGVGGV